MKIVLDNGAKMPTRGHKTDAGLDLYPIDGTDVIIPAKGSRLFDTGVHMEIPEGYVGLIRSRSGYMVNHDITTDGTIDCGYTGSIRVKLFNNSNKSFLVEDDNKIAQIVIVPYLTEELELVNELSDTDRGDNGFGSTGK